MGALVIWEIYPRTTFFGDDKHLRWQEGWRIKREIWNDRTAIVKKIFCYVGYVIKIRVTDRAWALFCVSINTTRF